MSHQLTNYERTRIIGVRASQIEAGAVCTVDTTGLFTAIDIAIKELNERKLPMILTRKLPSGKKILIPLNK